MVGRGPGLLGGARMTLRGVGGMVYFLFALVLFAALTNITAMDNDGRMPSLPSMDPGAAVEVGSAATAQGNHDEGHPWLQKTPVHIHHKRSQTD